MIRRTVRLWRGRVPVAVVLVTAAAAWTAPAASAVPYSVWDRLAQCESTGRWDINTGNGYYGGLQIRLSTWNEADGTRYATRPDLASRRQQIYVAERIVRMQGWDAWPQCARTLSLHGVPITAPTYVVGTGETLGQIASEMRIPGGADALYELNRDVIGDDPDALEPGTVLTLPS